MLTKTDLPKEYVIETYISKDQIEKSFDNLKNELKQNRLRVHGKQALEGKLFLNFLSTIVYNHISCKMSKTKMSQKYTIRELFMELKKLKAIKMSTDETIVSEITARQKSIFRAFNMPPPKSPTPT